MTKAQLIRTLEPFSDQMEIIALSDTNYKREPRLFYYFNGNDDAQILIVAEFEPIGKVVELKVRG